MKFTDYKQGESIATRLGYGNALGNFVQVNPDCLKEKDWLFPINREFLPRFGNIEMMVFNWGGVIADDRNYFGIKEDFCLYLTLGFEYRSEQRNWTDEEKVFDQILSTFRFSN